MGKEEEFLFVPSTGSQSSWVPPKPSAPANGGFGDGLCAVGMERNLTGDFAPQFHVLANKDRQEKRST